MWWLAIAAAAAADHTRAPPEGFVDLRAAMPTAQVDIGYHRDDNFTGGPLPGYGAPGAWLRAEAAASLAGVHDALAAEGLGIRVLDAYRPERASAAMVAWATRTGQQWVIENGYVARYSGHNRGNTVDVTMFRLEDGEPLDMGSAWDTFDKISHTRGVSGEPLRNRLALREAMVAAGWEPYSKEWWHFRYPMRSAAPRDVPYGCFEVPEGRWVPPHGWEEDGYQAPTWPTAVDCR